MIGWDSDMTRFSEIDEKVIGDLTEILGERNLLRADEISEDYGHDEFTLREFARMPAVVAKPTDAGAVSRLMVLAQASRIPVTPRGGGTGLCGGCIPLFGGILLSMEKMNRILEVDRENMTITCEAGVRLGDLSREAEKAGLFFPPHPGDENAFVGGLISTNAGGSRAVKYGVVRNFVRGLEVVLPGGDTITIGGKVTKNSSGYSLLHLVTGSEGTLGIVTKATIALMCPPPVVDTLIAPFSTAAEAVSAVMEIMNGGIIPMALELLEGNSLRVLEDKLGLRWPSEEGDYSLMAIVDGAERSEVDRTLGMIAEICAGKGALTILIADSPGKQREVLHMRSMLYEGIKPYTIETLDVSLPRSEMVGHVKEISRLSQELDIWIPTYGHAADGNLHSHITRARFVEGVPVLMEGDTWKPKYERARDEIHEDARKRGGLVSGEHGIGLVKKKYLASFLGERQIELMRGIKRSFDPLSIMNPGKIFDL